MYFLISESKIKTSIKTSSLCLTVKICEEFFIFASVDNLNQSGGIAIESSLFLAFAIPIGGGN